MLRAHEKYYFGLMFRDAKGEQDWIKFDKKVLKHEFESKNPIELEFRIRFYPMDVTQVLQYVTLYQVFLAAKRSILLGQLEISAKDALLLGALSLQAVLGDHNPEVHTLEMLRDQKLFPQKTVQEIADRAADPTDGCVSWRDVALCCHGCPHLPRCDCVFILSMIIILFFICVWLAISSARR